ncbi:hypothetical protein NA57DRAFT_41291 [Rhizodiscina lignyota]|uniref:Alpha/beta hydrolase fold-3 domain-containing protein n=1 Tax=Rhizodiscina lignyota TaxID=1504668 RepID=A0A9P4IDD2_9PEZI|nr:hypothetical protein NA57DRAFT_41291 [Rhizodiscina lignyota]
MAERGRPRWVLHVQALFWRSLMQIGMFLHKLASPRPPRPNFSREIKTTVAEKKGAIKLRFYVPKGYEEEKEKGDASKRYPVCINFHGGGFTLGETMDDARWADAVVQETGAVVVGVEYRRAPEHPFPTAVEDGVDAVLWLASNAEQLNLDADRFAISGFSSGGNMAFTVPLRLQEEMLSEATPNSSAESLIQKGLSMGRTLVDVHKEIKIVAIVSWYPSTDYTQSRQQRRLTCARPDQQLPAVFFELFDDSYLQPPTLDRSNPYLSPGVAPDYMLAGLPDEIVMFTCEWDMLLAEGERLRDRLIKEQHKNVVYHCIPGVSHAWDKAPNPLRVMPGVKEHYQMACNELNRVFWGKKK